MVKIEPNPIEEIVNVFNELYPNYEVPIYFTDELYEQEGVKGRTHFNEDGEAEEIYIDANVSVVGVVELIAHELSHVVAGLFNEHNKEWERVMDQLNESFNEKMIQSVKGEA